MAVLVVFQIFRFKIYKSCLLGLYLGTIQSFITPMIYYSFLNGTAYKAFDSESYDIYMYIGVMYITALLLFTEIVNRTNMIKYQLSLPMQIKNVRVKNLLSTYATSMLCVICIWIFAVYSKLPIFGRLLGSYSYVRPDTSGAIAHYITLQILMMIVAPILILYYLELYQRKIWQYLCFLFVIPFLFVAGGNVGLIAYFYIFLWGFKWNYKVDIKLFCSIIGLFFLYYFMKYENQQINMDVLWWLLESPFRRFFVTQAAMLINRIGMLKAGIVFQDNKIPETVFEYVYGQPGGSAPTIFLGDFIVWIGYPMGLLSAVIVMIILLYCGKCIDANSSENDLYKKWAYFLMLVILGGTSITIANCLRFVMGGATILAIYFDFDSRRRKGIKES